MKFRLYRENGALNSAKVFDAFSAGAEKLGLKITESPDGIPVIWSVLWHGRMSANKKIYEHCRNKNTPIVIIEVGNLVRGTTWRISVDHVNRLGYFGEGSIDYDRPKRLGLSLKTKVSDNGNILIAAQHQHSEQWPKSINMSNWVSNTVEEIIKFTDRKIVVRPHPRFDFKLNLKNISLERPKKILTSYDSYDINYKYHCTVNYNSGPGILAAVNGCPVIVDQSSMAYPISDSLENIENPVLKDRESWFVNLCHTEWLLEELAQGIPLKRILDHLSARLG